MVLSTRLCLAGIVIFGVPLVFIVQNAINSIKLARTNDPRINTRWISVIIAIVNVIACLVIIAVIIGLVIILINKTQKPPFIGPLVHNNSSSALGGLSNVASSLTDVVPVDTEVVAAALASMDSSSPSDTDVAIGRDSIIPKDSLVIQRDGNLFTIDGTTAKNFLNAVKKLKENDTLKILTKRSSS
jgi:hypothetical protein